MYGGKRRETRAQFLLSYDERRVARDDFGRKKVNGAPSGGCIGRANVLPRREDLGIQSVQGDKTNVPLHSASWRSLVELARCRATGQLAKKLGRRATSEYLEKVIRLKGGARGYRDK